MRFRYTPAIDPLPGINVFNEWGVHAAADARGASGAVRVLALEDDGAFAT